MNVTDFNLGDISSKKAKGRKDKNKRQVPQQHENIHASGKKMKHEIDQKHNK
jgi:hypothetical protein